MAPKIEEWVLQQVLCALYALTGESIHAHYPIEAIARRLRPEVRGTVKKALKKLEAMGLIYRKGGTKSYGLTRDGLRAAREKCYD